mgnify:CR=1 FL=1
MNTRREEIVNEHILHTKKYTTGVSTINYSRSMCNHLFQEHKQVTHQLDGSSEILDGQIVVAQFLIHQPATLVNSPIRSVDPAGRWQGNGDMRDSQEQ